MKAVVITKDNQQQLMARYGVDPNDTDQFPIGYIMITVFGDNGDERYEGVITQATFDEEYIKGTSLKNGFFAIDRK